MYPFRSALTVKWYSRFLLHCFKSNCIFRKVKIALLPTFLMLENFSIIRTGKYSNNGMAILKLPACTIKLASPLINFPYTISGIVLGKNPVLNTRLPAYLDALRKINHYNVFADNGNLNRDII